MKCADVCASPCMLQNTITHSHSTTLVKPVREQQCFSNVGNSAQVGTVSYMCGLWLCVVEWVWLHLLQLQKVNKKSVLRSCRLCGNFGFVLFSYYCHCIVGLWPNTKLQVIVSAILRNQVIIRCASEQNKQPTILWMQHTMHGQIRQRIRCSHRMVPIDNHWSL
jgi:hypothetical protein